MSIILDDPQPASAYKGIYDVPEVARYLKAATYGDVVYPASPATLIRWIRRGLVSSDTVEIAGHEILVDFEDVISMRVIMALRATGVSWNEIRRTDEWLRERMGVDRPFATEFLWTGQGQVFIEWTRRLLSASRHGQMALEMLRGYLIPIHGLKFSETTHKATSWEPVTGVVLEPKVQFGSPCLKGTRIPTRTIFGMIEAGDSVSWVAHAYGLSEDDVQVASEWEERLRSN